MEKLKISQIKKYILPLAILLVVGYGVYLYEFALPGKEDYWLYGDQYIEIAGLLNTDEYKDVTYLWDLSVVSQNKRCYYDSDSGCRIQYAMLIEKESTLKNTYFLKCPNWIIKITKWWWLNGFFETAYVYSKNGFTTLPSRTKEKINDQVITYLNYDGTYSASNQCNVK